VPGNWKKDKELIKIEVFNRETNIINEKLVFDIIVSK